MEYIGRFAPSPTGPLHFGSLVVALASYLDARKHNGQWLLRIEDLDPPRESHSAPAEIMRQLTAFGLQWDGEALFQSTRLDTYSKNLQLLQNARLLFPCTCKRQPGPYKGACRHKSFSDVAEPYAVRVLTKDQRIQFDDLIYGKQYSFPDQEVGDFVVRRKDGLHAYQLAVIVDDAFQGITHVIRGSDLLDSTPRQILLAQYLALSVPTYGHIPVVLGKDGHKLSKQSHAMPVDTDRPLAVLRQALQTLGQAPQRAATTVSSLLRQATKAWDLARVPRESTYYSA
jgi:glutamyl-Q tRNA(Asp) synthetase